MPKISQMPKRIKKQNDHGKVQHIPPTSSILPDADEEHASVSIIKINRWVSLGDAALNSEHPRTRKRAQARE